MTALRDITLLVNGQEYAVRVEPRKTLADTIREDCRLTGTHLGCEHGVCGACTILVDDAPVSSCIYPAVLAAGRQVWTAAGLATRMPEVRDRFLERNHVEPAEADPARFHRGRL